MFCSFPVHSFSPVSSSSAIWEAHPVLTDRLDLGSMDSCGVATFHEGEVEPPFRRGLSLGPTQGSGLQMLVESLTRDLAHLLGSFPMLEVWGMLEAPSQPPPHCVALVGCSAIRGWQHARAQLYWLVRVASRPPVWARLTLPSLLQKLGPSEG